ncbi:MAG TPA: hypothetical protein VGJ75_07200 [Dongiaceae bacterium]|jgi:hypothetical protein
MSAVTVDFDRLLGYKLIVRARAVTQPEPGAAHSSENGAMEGFAPILQAKIGMKPVIGLRYRGA